jgi:hypothetical protein
MNKMILEKEKCDMKKTVVLTLSLIFRVISISKVALHDRGNGMIYTGLELKS